MNNKILVYGLSDAQRSVFCAALPERYDLDVAECTTDLIVGNPVCTIIDAADMDKDSLRVLLAYYMDVGDRLDETVVWLGNVDLPKLPSFVQFENYLQLLLNCEQTIKQAQSRHDIMQQYTDIYGYLPRHAIAECLEADIYAALQRESEGKTDALSEKAFRLEWMKVLEMEKGPEFLASVYELCHWLKKINIFYRLESTCFDLLDWVMGLDETICNCGDTSYTLRISSKDLPAVESWFQTHWYFQKPDERLQIKAVEGLETGISSLDIQIMGMRPSEVILVGGRPAMGKTSFARGVAEHLKDQGKQVFYFDFVCNGKKVHKCFADFEQELRASGADFAVFDHFQFLSDYDETDETAERLFKKIKSLASELQIPIMVLLHLNENPETRPDPSPVTTDIPHRKTILPFVDTVLLLYRRAYYDPLVDRSTARCIIDKAKRCYCEVLSLRWDDEKHRFTD